MFKDLTINMAAPICGCTADKLTWSPGQEIISGSVRWTLIIGCSGCGTRLTVSEKNLIAKFAFDRKPNYTKAPPPPATTKTTTSVDIESTASVVVEDNDDRSSKKD